MLVLSGYTAPLIGFPSVLAPGTVFDTAVSRETKTQSATQRIMASVIRPIIFSINCYIAALLALFISFSLDLKSPAWAMVTVHLTSQPLSGA